MVFLIITFSIPAVQTKLAGLVTENLNEDFGTSLKISKVDLSFLGSVSLKGIEIKDHHQDTLIYVERLRSSLLDVKRILENNIQLKSTSLKGVYVNVKNYKDEEIDNLTVFVDKSPYIKGVLVLLLSIYNLLFTLPDAGPASLPINIFPDPVTLVAPAL